MLSISLTYPNDFKSDYTWYVGKLFLLPNTDYNYITELTASGEELEHIKNIFAVDSHTHNRLYRMYSIPIPVNKTVVRWYGDIAKTIAATL